MVEIRYEKENNRAMAYDNGKQIGECEYIDEDNQWNIVHTGVREEYQGQGIAKKLVDCVIENSIKNNKKIIAQCSYAKKIIDNK